MSNTTGISLGIASQFGSGPIVKDQSVFERLDALGSRLSEAALRAEVLADQLVGSVPAEAGNASDSKGHSGKFNQLEHLAGQMDAAISRLNAAFHRIEARL